GLGNHVGVYIVGHAGSATGNQILGNTIKKNSRYGVILYNAPANTVPQSGKGANTIRGSGIANFREFSGAATPANTGSSKVKGAKHHKGSPPHHAPVKHVSRARKAVVGQPFPFGPTPRRRVPS